MTHPLLTSALDYLARGRKILLMSSDKIPLGLCTDCAPYKSHAAHREVCACIKDPYGVCHSFYSATDDPAVLTDWLTGDYADAPCIAQATGTPSDIFVMEIDLKNGGLESLEKLIDEHGPIPETEMHLSQSGGTHYTFPMPEGMDVRNHTGEHAPWPGIDIKGTGGYALLPPSRGEKGQYRVLSSAKPAQAPQWLLDRIAELQQPRKPKGPVRVYDLAEAEEMSEDVRRFVEARLNRIITAEDGTQNNTLLWVGHQLFSLVFAELADEDFIREALADAAYKGGHPDHRAVATIESAFNRAEQNPDSVEDLLGTSGNVYKGCFTRRYSLDLPGNYSRLLAKHGDNFGYMTDRGVFAAYSERTGFWKLGRPSESAKDKSPVQHLVTDVFFNLRETEGDQWPDEPMVPGKDTTWKDVFEGFCKRANANTAAQDSVLKVLNYETPSNANEYISSLSSKEFDAQGDVLPFRNGVLELESGKFRRTRKEDKVTTYLPWDYAGSTDCTNFLEFLKRAQPDPAVRDYLQRRAGYALSASTSEKKFWIDQGIADAGKSTYDLILSEILGPFAYSADKNLFYASGEENPEKKGNLFHKRMVLLDEWDSRQKINSSLIKSIAAGGPDNGRFLYGDPFGFNHTGKVFITTNANVKMDLDSGLITRLVVVPWNVPITPTQKTQQQSLTGGVDFFRWVVARERMGIINWMAEGYRMWRERPLSVDVPESIQETTRAYLDNNPVNAYFFDKWVRTSDPKDKVKCSDFHRMFVESYDGDDRLEWTVKKVTQTIIGLQVEYKKSINFGVNPETGKKEVTSGFTGIKPKEK